MAKVINLDEILQEVRYHENFNHENIVKMYRVCEV